MRVAISQNGSSDTTTACSCSATQPVTYIWDVGANSVGRRTGMADASGSTAWLYDSRGRLTSETKTIGTDVFLSKWGYNSADLVSWMKYPLDNAGNEGEQVSYVYHTQMLFKNLFSNTNNYYYVKGTSYDAAGRVTWRGLGADSLPATPLMQSNYTYNPWSTQGGRLLQIQTGVVTDTTSLQKLIYNYDPVGDITWIQNHKAGGIQTQNFTYDALDRLTSSNATGGTGGTYATETYSYSVSTGNMASKAGVGYGYNDPEHAHAVTHLDGVQKYWYDANGNMTQRIVNGQTYNLSYDAESRLVGVSGAATASFVYDGDGNRVKSIIGGGTTLYIGNYFEYTSSGNTKYYYAGSHRIALHNTGYAGNNGLFWLLTDHLGSTTLTAHSQGTFFSEQRYKAWGETRYTSGTLLTKRQYTGQINEELLGLYFYNARWYDPGLGRFVQADTIVPRPGNSQAWDRFAYAYNNPIVYIDSSGNDPFTAFLLIVITAGCSIVSYDIVNNVIRTPAITEPRVSPPTSTDMTKWLVSQMKYNTNSEVTKSISRNWLSNNPVNKLGALKAWVGLVGTGGVWDFKVDINTRYPEIDDIKLGGKTYNFQAVANIYYGFIGRYVGIPEILLRAGAGAYQKYKWGKSKNPSAVGPWYPPYYFDQRFDSYWIGFGIYLFDEFGDDLNDLTEEEFEKYLDNYIEEYGDPPPQIIGHKK